MQQIKKAIIPAAGLGTRFLPATKAMPKEMLPIVDRPTIEYIVDEAVQSGIEDIIIVTGKGKRAIEDHFDHSLELEDNLMKKEKFEQLERIRKSANVDIHYIRQKSQKDWDTPSGAPANYRGRAICGPSGRRHHPERNTRPKADDEPVRKTKSAIIGVKSVPDDETHRYGIIDSQEKRVGCSR